MKQQTNPFIHCDPEIHHGRACFRGTRVPVYIVLELLEAGETPEEILEDYPRLTLRHVQAALHFAAETLKNSDYALLA